MSEKRIDILNATIRLLNREGVGVSTARIAKEAGVSNGTLFNYFPTKQELLDALYLHMKNDVSDILNRLDYNETAENVFREYWSRYFQWAKKNQAAVNALNLLLSSGLVSEAAREEFSKSFTRANLFVQKNIETGNLVNLGQDYIGALFISQINLALTHELTPEKSMTAFEVFWRGVRA